MEEEVKLADININQFPLVDGVSQDDYVVLSLQGGSSARLLVGLLQSSLISKVTPSIKDGLWWIGEINTEVIAEGQTPVFRKGDLGIEWKYTNQSDAAWELLVPLSEIAFKFSDLTEEQRDSISLKFSDLTEEEIAELQKPANDMIAVLTQTNNNITNAESARVIAEKARVDAETARTKAESARTSAENARVDAETKRATAEQTRVSQESARVTAETSRKTAETARASAEETRVASENTRISNENTRKSNEDSRKSEESARQQKETARTNAENARVKAEEDRVTAENARKSNETARETSESKRVDAETARADAEKARENEYQSLKEDILDATKNANDAATESRNTPIIKNGTWWIWSVEQDAYVDTATPATSKSPKIQNGTWWTWDDENREYVDSGQSVSSDYVLTKEKIEGVFTGDIESHWHSQYLTEHQDISNLATKQSLEQSLSGKVDKVDGKQLSTEDFTTLLKQKLDGLSNYNDTEITQAVEKLRSDLDAIVSGDTSSAIKTFNEVIAFLDGISDTEDLDGIIASLETQIADKQKKMLTFTNKTASEWVTDNKYGNFGYRCDIPCEGVDATMYAEVIFDVSESISGLYAPVCETKDGYVSIWSTNNNTIVIPTIIINR